MPIIFKKNIAQNKAHEEMLKRLSNTIKEKGRYTNKLAKSIEQTLMPAIKAKDYSQALRRLCNTPKMEALIYIMLEYSLILDIQPNEKNKDKLSAIDYAKKNNPSQQALLLEVAAETEKYKLKQQKAQLKQQEISNLAKSYQRLDYKTITIDTPWGTLPYSEFKERMVSKNKSGEASWGQIYTGFDEITGILKYPGAVPTIGGGELYELISLVDNIGDYKSSAEIYSTAIKSMPYIKWHLITLLIDEYQQNKAVAKSFMSDFFAFPKPTPALLQDRALFQSLVAQGAEYKHYLHGAYGSPNPQTISRLFSLFGKEITAPAPDGTNLLLANIITAVASDPSFGLAKALLKAGLNINDRMENHFGNTLLHYLIALEVPEIALEYIRLVEQMTEQNKEIPAIDYTIQDNQGKTALWLAVGLGLKTVVNEILAIGQGQGIDVGVNIPDQAGRTPIMIAAALGRSSLYQHLIAQGACLDAVDNEGRNLEWYVNAPAVEIKAILQFLSVNPERGCYVDHSHLCSADDTGHPLVLVDRDEKEHLLLLSPQKEAKNLLKAARFLAPKHAKAIDIQLLPLTKHSGKPHYKQTITERCIEKQVKLKQSFWKSENISLVQQVQNTTIEENPISEVEENKEFVSSHHLASSQAMF